MSEPDGVETMTVAFQLQFQVTLLEHALVQHLELVAEYRRCKALAPYLASDQVDEVGGEVGVFQRAVGFDHVLELAFAERGPADCLEGGGKGVESLGADRQPGSHRVAAELVDQGRRLLRYQVERVAQVKAGDGPSGTFDPAVAARREGDGRAVELVLQARRDDADHALVPGGVEDGDGRAVGRTELVQQRQCMLVHAGLDLAPFAVDAVELLRDGPGAAFVVGGQALDAERHVGQPARRVQARS